MSYTVTELREALESIEEEHPDAEVKIDPPWASIFGVYVKEVESGTVVEVHH